MKIIVPEVQTCLRTMFNFLSTDEHLLGDVIYTSLFNPNVYIWRAEGTGRVHIYLDEELDVFIDEELAARWIIDSDLEPVFNALEVTDLKAVLTIS